MEQSTLTNLKPTRRHRSVSEIRQLLRSQRKSKLTIKNWCAANGIRENNFYRWLKKYADKPVKPQQHPKVASVKGFTRLAITPVSVTKVAPSLFAEIGQLRIYQEVPASYLKTLLS